MSGRVVLPTTFAGQGDAALVPGDAEPLVPSDGALRIHTVADGLPAADVRCALADRRGDHWFGTRGGGVARLSQGAWTVFTSADGLASDGAGAVHEDAGGRLWFAGKGLSRFDPERRTWRTVTTADGLAGTVVFAIRAAPDASLWFGTNRGASRLHDGRWTSISAEAPLPHFVVHDVLVDARGDLWLATRAGLARRAGDDWQVLRAGTNVRRACVGPDGTPWFGTASEGALAYVDGVFESTAPVPMLLPEVVDDHRALWFSSAGAGAFRLHQGRLQRLGREQGLPSDVVHGIASDGAGGVLFATDAGAAQLLQTPRPAGPTAPSAPWR